MKAKSIKGKTATDISVAFESLLADGYKPTLAIVFLSATEEISAVASLLSEKGISIFGANTMAEFTEEGAETTGVAVLLLDVDPAYFKIILEDFGSDNGFKTGCLAGEFGVKAFNNPAFIISSSDYKVSGDNIIKGIVEKAGTNFPIVGGKAGDAVQFRGTVFTNNKSSENGLICLVIDQDKIALKGMAASGWKPAGTEKKITSSTGAWIHTIDDQPAFDVVKKFLGDDIIDDDKKGGVVRLSLIYPLQLHRRDGSPLMLPILFANTEDNSVMLAEEVPEGSLFRFSMPPDFDVIDSVIQSASGIKENEMSDADAMIIFSCVGRLASLGPMSSSEVKGLAGTWNSPMIGFFSLGEFGRVANGNPEFHGTTVSWAALKEK